VSPRALRGEEGWALVTSLLVTAILMGTVLSTFSFVDAQQRASAAERRRESTFNVAESALNAQTFGLSGANWPASAAVAPCDQSTHGSTCPSDAALRGLHASQDTGGAVGWRTEVRDNIDGARTFYSDAATQGADNYDRNGDRKVWVRAEATIEGRKRVMVVLSEIERRSLNLPRAVLRAHSLTLENQGQHRMVHGGDAVTGGQVQVRCDPTQDRIVACLGHPLGDRTVEEHLRESRWGVQVHGPAPLWGGRVPQGAVITPADREQLKAMAQAAGTYSAGCPASLAGKVVYVADATGCRYTTGTFNAREKPGLLVIERGQLQLAGNLTYHGLLYHANLGDVAGVLVDFQGTAAVVGGVIVEGRGNVGVGRAHDIVTFNANALDVAVNGTAIGLRSTWREVAPS
jgi:Tfp pilus assembly protein PilX